MPCPGSNAPAALSPSLRPSAMGPKGGPPPRPVLPGLRDAGRGRRLRPSTRAVRRWPRCPGRGFWRARRCRRVPKLDRLLVGRVAQPVLTLGRVCRAGVQCAHGRRCGRWPDRSIASWPADGASGTTSSGVAMVIAEQAAEPISTYDRARGSACRRVGLDDTMLEALVRTLGVHRRCWRGLDVVIAACEGPDRDTRLTAKWTAKARGASRAFILPSNAARTVSNRGRYRRSLTGDGMSGSDAVFTE